jgi:sarcosine oxidase subunit beta
MGLVAGPGVGSGMERFDVVVVGAGVVGAAVAYRLAQRGQRVCLLDRGGIAGGTSSASAGQTSAQARPPGPILDLARANLEILRGLSAELGYDIEYVESGGIIVAEDEVEQGLIKRFVALQERHVPVRFLEAADLRRLEPGLAPHFLGGSYCATDGYVNPMRLAKGLCLGAGRLGAEIRLHTEVVGLWTEGDRVCGVRTAAGGIAAGAVVNAAGVWAPELARSAGLPIPVIPRKGQLIVTEPVPMMLQAVVSHAGHIPFAEFGIEAPGVAGELQKKRYLKQAREGGFRGRFYIGSTSEFVGFDRGSTLDGVAQLARYAVATVPGLRGVRLMRAWAGLRPRSEDGRFLIGAAPGLRGLYLATGHDSIGVLHSSMTGLLLAALIVEGRRDPRLELFDPARLAAGAERK